MEFDRAAKLGTTRYVRRRRRSHCRSLSIDEFTEFYRIFFFCCALLIPSKKRSEMRNSATFEMFHRNLFVSVLDNPLMRGKSRFT